MLNCEPEGSAWRGHSEYCTKLKMKVALTRSSSLASWAMSAEPTNHTARTTMENRRMRLSIYFWHAWERFGMRKTVALVLLLHVTTASGQQTAQNELKKMTLEELMDINVTSVARTADPLSRTAAAVTVITAEDIRRSGATNVPEILRLAPGVNVARFGSGSWAISARGFNSTAADKLLVMIDGRTVYSPLFSGTFWEVQDLVLEDIERIEVVRGPGATLWGANAVNGIINIITKTAHQTLGGRTTVTGGGAEDLAAVSSRYGASLGSDVSYRIDGKYAYRDQLKLANGGDAKDSTRIGHIDFRAD